MFHVSCFVLRVVHRSPDFATMIPLHMQQIIVDSLSKSFTVRDKDQGRFATIRSLIAPRTHTKKAVESLSFTITQGELVGFIGPNGAGKTTTLKMLAGLLYPTTGSVRVLGYDPFLRDHTYLRQISLVMGQKQQLWWELPVRDSLELNREIYEIPQEEFRKTCADMTEIFDLADVIHLPPRVMSLGQRMKCELVASLLHKPKVLFLDEPTIGLDVVMQDNLRSFIADYNRRYHATVILTSHYMNDVKKLCDRVIIINNGSLVFDGKLADLVRNFAHYKVISVTFTSRVATQSLKKFGTIESSEDTTVRIRTIADEARHVASRILSDYDVDDITIHEHDIEDVIREVFTR